MEKRAFKQCRSCQKSDFTPNPRQFHLCHNCSSYCEKDLETIKAFVKNQGYMVRISKKHIEKQAANMDVSPLYLLVLFAEGQLQNFVTDKPIKCEQCQAYFKEEPTNDPALCEHCTQISSKAQQKQEKEKAENGWSCATFTTPTKK